MLHLPPWARLIVHRVALAAPVLFVVTLLAFFILNLLPGNAASLLLGVDATAAQVAELEARLHLDRPLTERFVIWLKDALSADLGRSLASNQPVTTLIAERFPVTLQLVGYAFLLSLGLSIPAALLAARAPTGFIDRLTLFFSMVSISLPGYVLAPVLVLAFAVYLPWLPSFGFVPLTEGLFDNFVSMILPATSIALPLTGFYLRFLRDDLVEQMRREEYTVAALANGLTAWQVLVRHALRNSVFGLMTVMALNFGVLLGGTVIIEQIFALPGLGQLLLQAINTRDAPVVQGIVLLLALAAVLANLTVDILYTLLDPRIRYAHV